LLDQADRDQAAAARLDQVRSDRAISNRGHFGSARAIAEYESMFRALEIGQRGDDPAQFASRIERSNIQAIQVSAIEDWAAITEGEADLDWLLQIARAAIDDPTGWRQRVLTLGVWTEQSEVAQLLAAAPVTENSVPLLLALGERYGRQGGNPVEFLKKCHKVRPHDFWANIALGHALRAHENPLESMRYFQAAVAIRPDSALAYNELGLSLIDFRRFDDAIEMFQEAVRVDPAVEVCAGNLGMALSLAGRHAEAIPILRKSASLMSGEPMLYGSLGSSLNAVGQTDEAWKNFERAVELDATILARCHQIRVQLLRGQRGAEFLTLWRKALAADPAKHDVWDGYAELSLFLGRESEYRWACRELLKRFGDAGDPPIAERVGRACLLLPGTEDELRQASVLIGRAMNADRSKLGNWVDTYFSFAQGLLAYRQCRFDESAAIMKGSAARVLGPAPGLVLAMDQFQLGHKGEARMTLEKALNAFDWQPAKAHSREAWICQILRREADRLIKPKT
jgi:serine/threonine-protein kinase